jgi:hypothetical protein
VEEQREDDEGHHERSSNRGALEAQQACHHELHDHQGGNEPVVDKRPEPAREGGNSLACKTGISKRYFEMQRSIRSRRSEAYEREKKSSHLSLEARFKDTRLASKILERGGSDPVVDKGMVPQWKEGGVPFSLQMIVFRESDTGKDQK